MKKYYTLEEAKRRFLGNAKLSQRKINTGVSNINCLCHYLGKAWVERNFRGSSGTTIFFTLSNIGEQLKYIKGTGRYRILVKKFKLARTQQEFNPYLTELSIISKFAKYKIPIYYEPIIHINGKRKIPDFRFKINHKWVYAEVCAPKNIMWTPLTRISRRLLDAIKLDKQYSLFVLLTKEPNSKEMETLIITSTEMIKKFERGSCSKVVDDFARIVVDDSDPRIVSRFIKVRKGYHTTNVCSLKNYKGKLQKINLQILFTDDRAENILRKEARHFSNRTNNLIIFCMGSLGKSMTKWKSIIVRRLRGDINRRINGVFLLDSAMSGSSGKSIKRKLVYIPHQNPRKPLKDGGIELIKRVLLN